MYILDFAQMPLIRLRRSPSSLLSDFIATSGIGLVARASATLICECYPLFFLFYSISKENYMDPVPNMKPNLLIDWNPIC